MTPVYAWVCVSYAYMILTMAGVLCLSVSDQLRLRNKQVDRLVRWLMAGGPLLLSATGFLLAYQQHLIG